MKPRIFTTLALISALAFSGCAGVKTEAGKIGATIKKEAGVFVDYVKSPTTQARLQAGLDYVRDQTAQLVAGTLFKASVDEIDSNFKGNYVDYIALELRKSENTITEAAQVQQLVEKLAPDDGSKWQQLASGLADQFSQAQGNAGHTQTAQIVEAIADGLNNQTAVQRSAATDASIP